MSKEITDNLKISCMAASERPRERLLLYGAGSLSNTDLLALVISSGTPRYSALDLAGRVLAMENGNIAALSNCIPQEFLKLPGIGAATACRISAALELGNRVFRTVCPDINLNSPENVFDFCSDLRHLTKEIFRVILLNSKLGLIKTEDISIGGISATSASPREVFSCAIKAGAYGVILVHNHPSGDPNPSGVDISTTGQLLDAGKILGISVLDHIIIGKTTYFSFKEENLL